MIWSKAQANGRGDQGSGGGDPRTDQLPVDHKGGSSIPKDAWKAPNDALKEAQPCTRGVCLTMEARVERNTSSRHCLPW